MTAYFTPDGELMGVIHNMLSTQLPINLQTSLKKEYDGYWITELFEMAKSDSNSYFVTLHNADQIITLESKDGSHGLPIVKQKNKQSFSLMFCWNVKWPRSMRGFFFFCPSSPPIPKGEMLILGDIFR